MKDTIAREVYRYYRVKDTNPKRCVVCISVMVIVMITYYVFDQRMEEDEEVKAEYLGQLSPSPHAHTPSSIAGPSHAYTFTSASSNSSE